MRFSVALDDPNDSTGNTWMPGEMLPCAVIINEDLKVVWMGHSLGMEVVLPPSCGKEVGCKRIQEAT